MEGTLACRFKSTADAYIYLEVPEAKYQSLIRSKFAGSYFRKQIKDKYTCIAPNGIPLPAKMDDSPIKAKQAKQAKKRLEAVKSPTLDLFGMVLPGNPPQPGEKRSTGL
jgi:hypothetical protein